MRGFDSAVELGQISDVRLQSKVGRRLLNTQNISRADKLRQKLRRNIEANG